MSEWSREIPSLPPIEGAAHRPVNFWPLVIWDVLIGIFHTLVGGILLAGGLTGWLFEDLMYNHIIATLFLPFGIILAGILTIGFARLVALQRVWAWQAAGGFHLVCGATALMTAAVLLTAGATTAANRFWFPLVIDVSLWAVGALLSRSLIRAWRVANDPVAAQAHNEWMLERAHLRLSNGGVEPRIPRLPDTPDVSVNPGWDEIHRTK